jgi:hypothetical protein
MAKGARAQEGGRASQSGSRCRSHGMGAWRVRAPKPRGYPSQIPTAPHWGTRSPQAAQEGIHTHTNPARGTQRLSIALLFRCALYMLHVCL